VTLTLLPLPFSSLILMGARKPSETNSKAEAEQEREGSGPLRVQPFEESKEQKPRSNPAGYAVIGDDDADGAKTVSAL